MCVVFNQGCCVFIQYNLLQGCYEWILIQPWTQVVDYALPGLTCHIRLRIGISHLSISAIVVHGRCYIPSCFYFSVIFYDCFLVDLCFLFFFSSLLTVVWPTKNLFWPVYFLSDWSLNFIILLWCLLHHIIVFYISKFHYSRLLYLIMSWLFI